jgi:hypothetical protein
MPKSAKNAMRRANWEAKLADLAEGRKQRATSIPPKKGKGSYKRKSKYNG